MARNLPYAIGALSEDETADCNCRGSPRLKSSLIPFRAAYGRGPGWQRAQQGLLAREVLHPWPITPPEAWVSWVNEPLPHETLHALRRCVNRGQPFGDATWQARTAAQLGLTSTFRPRGRPRKAQASGASQ